MIKKSLLLVVALLLFNNVSAMEIVIDRFRYAGPFELKMPFLVDSLNVKGKGYAEKDMLSTPVSFDSVRENGREVSGWKFAATPPALFLAMFYLNSDRYAEGTLTIKGEGTYEVYVNDKLEALSGGEVKLTLEPRRYEIIIKYLVQKDEAEALDVSFKAEGDAVVTATTDPARRYTVNDVMEGSRIQSVSLSPDGKYILVRMQTTYPGGKQASNAKVIDKTTGNDLFTIDNRARDIGWMPKTNRLYFIRDGVKGAELVTLDPVTKAETVLASGLPDGSFFFSPTEDFLLFSISEKGPEKDKDLQEILVPDDRQPGWRDRTFIHKYDLATGLQQRLTFGHTSTRINDISNDGRYLLFSCDEPFLTERPFSRTSFYCMDLQTMQTDTVFEHEKFVNRLLFSPDGKQLLVSASGDAFGGIGLKIAAGQKSNTSDTQLYLYNLADKKVTPLTKDFDPSVNRASWNKVDKQIYAQVIDRDYVRLYRIDPVKGSIKRLPLPEDILLGISFATGTQEAAYYGMSASNSQRLYTLDLKKDASTCLVDASKELLKDIELGEVKDWNFVSASGDTIYGRYYLPPHFDPAKKYPLIVNYYGGTTPTARALEGRYASHTYAALGYIVYILQPSGATGFGQEFSARHVNAWGKQTGDEIIEGTKKFCAEQAFVDKEKIGCIGASYGGFMTMYLLTKTDIFAAGISHAGISDITSYWGEGYWGYSYSALASADSYPWNAPEMYVGQSPLFSADKIHTPLLFLHGAADTNVPIGESIQMFTALKLLGRETAFIQVDGENHHILQYDKRLRWNQTIFAWFAKWLKDQPEWWEALYPPKSL